MQHIQAKDYEVIIPDTTYDVFLNLIEWRCIGIWCRPKNIEDINLKKIIIKWDMY